MAILAIVARASSSTSIESCVFDRNRIGVEVKDSSFVYVMGGHIHNSIEFGVHAYSKNWRYNNGGHVEVRDVSLDNRCDASGDERSSIWLVNSQSRGSINSSCLTWSEEVDWGEARAICDLADVQVDETYEDNFLSRSDGWASESETTRFYKRDHVLHAVNEHEPVSISRQIASTEAPAKTIELLLGTSQRESVEVVLELTDGTRESKTIAMSGTERVKPYRIRCSSGISKVLLRCRTPRCRLSIMKMRLW